MDILHHIFLARIDGALIPIVMFLCATLIVITAILKGKGPSRENAQSREETKTIQELYAQCNRLAERIEALETILMEQERKNKSESQ